MIKTCSPNLILADLKFDCPEAPTSVILRALTRAARKFSTTCMYETTVEIPTQSGVQHYPFERYLPKGWGVQYVKEVKYNECCIKCLDDDCNSMRSCGYRLDDLNQITLVGYYPSNDEKDPTCKDRLSVKVSLRINSDTCEFPCDMIERFDEELKAGTMGLLLSMKRKAWTDLSMAEYYLNRFDGHLASIKCLVADKMNPEDSRIPGERML